MVPPKLEAPMKSRGRSFHCAVIVQSLILCFAALAVAQKPSPLADAQADFAAQKYQPCLAKISQLLRDPAQTDPDLRYDAMMLRGECFIQMQASDLARDAYALAASSTARDGDIKQFAGA